MAGFRWQGRTLSLMLVIRASARGSDGPPLKTCVLAHCLEPVAIGSSWVTEYDLARETVVSQMASQGNSKLRESSCEVRSA